MKARNVGYTVQGFIPAQEKAGGSGESSLRTTGNSGWEPNIMQPLHGVDEEKKPKVVQHNANPLTTLNHSPVRLKHNPPLEREFLAPKLRL